MVLIDDNDLIDKSGTTIFRCQMMALNLSTKTCDSVLNDLQI